MREAPEEAGHIDLIENGCDALIPKRGYHPGRTTQERQRKSARSTKDTKATKK